MSLTEYRKDLNDRIKRGSTFVFGNSGKEQAEIIFFEFLYHANESVRIVVDTHEGMCLDLTEEQLTSFKKSLIRTANNMRDGRIDILILNEELNKELIDIVYCINKIKDRTVITYTSARGILSIDEIKNSRRFIVSDSKRYRLEDLTENPQNGGIAEVCLNDRITGLALEKIFDDMTTEIKNKQANTKSDVKMRTVIEVNSKKMTVEFREVPMDYIECTHCGEWVPRESFGLNDEGQRTRTNCEECYMMKIADYEKTGKDFVELKKINLYVISSMKDKISSCGKYKTSCTVKDVIAHLMTLPQDAKIMAVDRDSDSHSYIDPFAVPRTVHSDVYGNTEIVYIIGDGDN